MKTTTMIIRVWIAMAGLLTGQLATAQESLNLSAFKGKYKGAVSQVGPGAGNTASGLASVGFKVPQSGTSARIRYTAAFSDDMGDTNVLPTSMDLTSNQRVSVTDLLVGIAGTNNAKPGTGDWIQRKRILKIDATNGEGITLRGTAVVKDLRNKRKLTLTLVSDDGVDTRTFTTRLRARLPRQN
ncbi:MAG: hypothetical protein QE273_11005 [Verrucomicrobiales bacterium]|nr:hypothetical protein [Verrucomicrobiales bacterium]